MNDEFQLWVPSTGRQVGEKYKDQLVCVTSKGYIWLSTECLNFLGGRKKVRIRHNTKEWALQIAGDDDVVGVYKIDPKGRSGSGFVRAAAFIKMMNIPVKYAFKGRIVDDMIVFNKTPFEKIGV